MLETRISEDERALLECWVAAPTTPQSVAVRARIVLKAGAGESNSQVARTLGVSRPTVILWRSRFREGGVAALTETRPGRGRKPSISSAKVKAIVQATTQTRPAGQTHWSCRTMAKAQGVSPATVQRIWDAHGLKPHRVKTFKLSNDPCFTEKLTDVVGLYLNPPEKAIVLCVDEKSQIQALDRTQASPHIPRLCTSTSHDCVLVLRSGNDLRRDGLEAEASSGPRDRAFVWRGGGCWSSVEEPARCNRCSACRQRRSFGGALDVKVRRYTTIDKREG